LAGADQPQKVGEAVKAMPTIARPAIATSNSVVRVELMLRRL
jgi:hypothetical protein